MLIIQFTPDVKCCIFCIEDIIFEQGIILALYAGTRIKI